MFKAFYFFLQCIYIYIIFDSFIHFKQKIKYYLYSEPIKNGNTSSTKANDGQKYVHAVSKHVHLMQEHTSNTDRDRADGPRRAVVRHLLALAQRENHMLHGTRH